MRRNFYFTCVLGAKVAPGTVRKAKGDGHQLRPEFLKLSQVATENSTPSLRRDDDAVHKMRDGPLLIVA